MDLAKIIDKKINKMKRMTFKDFLPSLTISLISIFIVSALHFLGTFDFLELKMYDFKYGIRGPLSATGGNNSWPLSEKFTDSNKSGKWDESE